MIVIFKIIMDFDDLVGIVNKFQNSFDVIFVNGQMFIFAKNLKKYTVNKIKKILNNENAFITIIDENNLSRECDKVISWCRDKFVENDLLRYEKENQERIKQMNNFLDDFEENLEKILKERM